MNTWITVLCFAAPFLLPAILHLHSIVAASTETRSRWPIPSMIVTALYWAWESRTGGNIRIDLLLIYPALALFYLFDLWPRFRFWSLLIAAGLMALDLGFFIISYPLFRKHPG
jgi:hypothetical protein